MKPDKILVIFLLAMNLIYSTRLLANQDMPIGKIIGTVTDADTKLPLAGANVILKDTQLGAATDEDGNFKIENVPVGNYNVQFNYMGYQDITKTDIIVRSNRITFCHIEMIPSTLETEVIEVSGGYFSKNEENPTSTVNFSYEEIRRAPGSAGDVSRIIFGLPSVAKVNDAQNALIVRGGSSFETGFYIDNIEVPNINHYPEYGSSGGPIGMLNVDFISDVNFYAGGFSAIYNDKMSSIMELSFREGNREEFDGQLDFSFAGMGLVGEGLISSGKGSWLLTLRKSYLDLIVEVVGQSEYAVPNYGDMQTKIVYDLNPNHKIMFLDILGIDEIHMNRKNALEEDMGAYFDQVLIRNTAGLNWRFLWNKKGYSNTSFSHTVTNMDYTSYDTRVYRDSSFEKKVFDFKPQEHEFKLRNVNYIIFNPANKIQIGFEAKNLTYYQNNYYGNYNDDLGRKIPAFRVDDNLSVTKVFGFLQYSWQPLSKLTISPGLNTGHFTYNKNTNLSPRLNLAYKLSGKTTVHGAAGIYYQNLPVSLLVQNNLNKDLKDSKAYHYIIGMSYLLTDDTKLTVEAYDKEYQNLPVDPLQPTFCQLDQIVYDNRITMNIEGGYKPNNKWEFSFRWTYAGGRPYTPFDESASEVIRHGVYDAELTNEVRLPDYHNLNVRCDRRYNFSGSALIMYFSLWNAYGRKNISMYYWDSMKNEKEAVRQWSFLPVFGLEFEF